MSLDWTAFQLLSADNPPHTVRLSPDSFTLFFMTQGLTEVQNWETETGDLTVAETDAVDAMVSEAYDELLRNTLLGTIFPFVTADPPYGSLECDGSTQLRVDYPALYAVLDAFFITDADHFILPDLRGRTLLGAGAGAGLTTYAVGDSGGEETHVLTTAELASHAHSTNPHSHTDLGHVHSEGIALPSIGAAIVGVPVPSAIPGIGVTGIGNASLTSDGVTVNSEGGDTAHENRQPYLALRYAIWPD